MRCQGSDRPTEQKRRTRQHAEVVMRQRLKSMYNGCLIWVASLRLRTIMLWRRTATATGTVVITMIAVAAGAAVFYFPAARAALDAYQAVDTILIALGATFGTILALVLTLSIIPVQRAADVWSPSIIRLYRRDKLTHFTFIILGIFCAASFLLSVTGLVGISSSVVLVTAIVVLGLSLDLLRWYHRHICQLLDPAYAVETVTKYARQSIDRIQKSVTHVAKVQYRALTSEQKKEVNLSDIESIVYPQMPAYPHSINYWIHEIGEIASKGAARGEKYLASAAISSIREIVIYFVSTRKDNLILYPSPDALFLASESDIKVVINQAYEVLQDINRTAVVNGDESTSLRISEAFQGIAVHFENMSARNIRPNTSPLAAQSIAYQPIAYMMSCVKYAQEKGLDEVPFQSAEILAKISLAAPKDITLTDVHIPVIDGIQGISINFYVKRNAVFAEHVVGHPMAILDHLLDKEDSHYRELLRHVLENMEILAPLAVANEKLQGRLNSSSPMGKAYGLSNPQSLGYLFSKATKLIKVDEERQWINPYHELVEILDVYCRHFRGLGEQIEFGESFLLREITLLIKHIAVVIQQLISQPVRPDRGDEQQLVDKIGWLLSFFWVAFDKKKTVNQHRADEACDVLVYTGLLFFEYGYPNVLKTAVSHIRSIIGSYSKTNNSPDAYALGDMYAHLWCLRRLANARSNAQYTQLIDEILGNKPETLTDEQWKQAQNAIELRRQQLEQRLEERDDYNLRDSTDELLRRLLQS